MKKQLVVEAIFIISLFILKYCTKITPIKYIYV